MLYQQPQVGPLHVDSGNPFTRQLKFLWNAALPERELLAQSLRTTDNTAKAVATLGKVVSSSTAQVNLEWNKQFVTTSTSDGLGDFTIAVYANPASSGAAVEHIFCQKNDAGGSPFAQCGLLAQANSSAAFSSGSFSFFTFNSTGSSQGIAVAGACDDAYHWWVGVRRGTTMELYKDGVLLTSAVKTVVAITQSASRYTAIGSRGNGTTEGYTKQAVLAVGWDRAISADEAKLNPWQLILDEDEEESLLYVQSGGATYTLTAVSGSYSLTGNATALTAARKLSAVSGSYALTGNTAAIVVSRKMTLTAGSYSLSGQDAALRVARNVVCSSGSYSLAGVAAAFKAARKLTAVSGSYTLTGHAATLTAGVSNFNATVLVNGIPNKITSAQLGTGLAAIVYVSGRYRQRVAAEGTPLVFDPSTNRWRLLRAGETLNI